MRNLRSCDVCKALSTVSATQALSYGSGYELQLGSGVDLRHLSGSENVNALYMIAHMN